MNYGKSYIKLDDTLLQVPKKQLSLIQKLIVSYILSWQASNKTCYTSQTTLANNFSSSLRTINAAIRSLKKYSWFNFSKNKTSNNTLQLGINLDDLLQWIENHSNATKKENKVNSKVNKPQIVQSEQEPQQIDKNSVDNSAKLEISKNKRNIKNHIYLNSKKPFEDILSTYCSKELDELTKLLSEVEFYDTLRELEQYHREKQGILI